MKKGFTIVELLITVSVLAVLMTIVTTAATKAINASRERQAEAMRVALQASIANFQAADPQGEWPGAIQNAANNGRSVVLSEDEAQRVFRIIVQKSTGESGSPLPLIDPHGLVVAPSGAIDGKSTGLSFDEARQGGAHRRKIPVSQMVFGYQSASNGRFHRYNIVYHAETDSVTVSTESRNSLDTRYGTKK